MGMAEDNGTGKVVFPSAGGGMSCSKTAGRGLQWHADHFNAVTRIPQYAVKTPGD